MQTEFKSCIQTSQRYMEVHKLCNVQLFSSRKVEFYMASSRNRNQVVGQPFRMLMLSVDNRQVTWGTMFLMFFALHQAACPVPR